MLCMEDETCDVLECSLRDVHLTIDTKFLKKEVFNGKACVTSLIINGNLVVSNVGDFRVVLSRNYGFDALPCDHQYFVTF